MYTIDYEIPRLTRLDVIMALDKEGNELFKRALAAQGEEQQKLFKRHTQIMAAADQQFDLYMKESRRAG
jgi:hypothetical protein